MTGISGQGHGLEHPSSDRDAPSFDNAEPISPSLRIDAADAAAHHSSVKQRRISPIWVFGGLLLSATLSGAFFLMWPGFQHASVEQRAQPTRSEPPPQPQKVVHAEHTADDLSEPVKQLHAYVQGLRAGSFVFNLVITGEEATKQLGFTRLFASAYDEVLVRTKARIRESGSVHISEILREFDAVLAEEMHVDRLLQQSGFAAAIAYLRAMQNGDAVFPGPQAFAPVPEVLLSRVNDTYPGTAINVADPLFATAYRQTREFATTRVTQAGEVWIHEIIGEFRRLIVHASRTPEQEHSAQSRCRRGTALGELVAVTRLCERLRLSASLQVLANELGKDEIARECQAAALADVIANTPHAPETVKGCEAAEAQVRAGALIALDVRN